MFKTTAHTSTSVLTISYTYHHLHLWCPLNNGTALCINSTVADNGCPSFYDLSYLQYISNALWIDVVLWAHVFTHILNVDVCEMDWNEIEGGKKSLYLISTSRHLSLSFTLWLQFASLTLSLEINDKNVQHFLSFAFNHFFKMGW